MRKITALSAILFFVFGQLINAQTSYDLNKKLPLDPKVKYGKLENGLTYYVRENAEPKNRAQLLLAINAGSIFEDDDQKGLAHMCEHMAFNGTKNFPKHELIEYLESIGMKFGSDINAYTSFDETVYMLEVPLDNPEFMDKGLQVIADWAANVSYEDEEIEAERGIIFEEWRVGTGATQRINKQIFPYYLYNSKYAERMPIGDTAVFMQCSPQKLRDFYKDWYRPSLQAVIIVGDFDGDKIVEQVKAKFSALEVRENPRSAVYPEIPDHEETLIKVVTDKEQPYSIVRFLIKHTIEPFVSYGDYKDYLKEIIFEGMVNQRFKEITMKPDAPFGYAANGYSHLFGTRDAYNLFALAKGDKIKETASALFSELQNIKQNGFTQSEFELQKKSSLKSVEKVYSERNKQKSQGLAFELKSHFDITQSAVPGIELEYELYQKLIPEITLEEVNALVTKWLTDKNMVLTVSAPEKEGLVMPTEDELRKMLDEVKNMKFEAKKEETLNKSLLSKVPKAGKIKKTETNKLLGTTSFYLANGAKVVIKPTDFKDDEIMLEAYSWGGYSLYSLEDNFSAREAASIIANSGLAQLNNVEFSKYKALLNANVSPVINMYSEGFRGSSSVNDFDKMLELIYGYFTDPRNDKDAFDAYINQTKSFIENRSSDPRSVFREGLMASLNGNSPYLAALTVENISKIDYNRVLDIYKERFANPSEFTFIFTGNIDAEKAKPIITKYLGSIKGKKAKENYKDLGIRYPEKSVRKEVYKGESPKSMAYMFFPSTFNNLLADKILLQAVADVFTDKLLKKVREEESLTYSISASPSTKYYPVLESGIGVYYSSAPENIDTITAMILDIVKEIQTNISDDDVTKSIEKAKRAYETKIRQNNYWSTQIALNEKIGSNTEFVNLFDEAVAKITKEGIQNAAIKYLNPEHYILVDLQPEK